MAYENITLRKQNVVMVDGYFYMIDEDLDNLIVKTDDGTQAFSYPLDTTISTEISSLEYDGRNFWTLENLGSNTIRIRRWYIDNYVLKLRDGNTYSETGSDKYESDAFTVEHYHETFTGTEVPTQTRLSISDGSKLQDVSTVTLGPNSSGEIEECSVIGYGSNYVDVNPAITYTFLSGDPVSFYKNIWIFNDHNGIDENEGALYKFNAYTWGSKVVYAGGAYANVAACTFYDMSAVYDPVKEIYWSDAICYIKGTNMIFLDPDDISTSFGSMVMDNVEDDNATVIAIYDVTMYGDNVYRLQGRATYYGDTYPGSGDWATYNYQLSTLEPFVTSISLAADPAILPADLGSTSTITAIVKDQFLNPIGEKDVYFTDDDANGYILTSPVETDVDTGVATTSYRAGSTANEVRITATVQQ
jgi:hypothetical protein